MEASSILTLEQERFVQAVAFSLVYFLKGNAAFLERESKISLLNKFITELIK